MRKSLVIILVILVVFGGIVVYLGNKAVSNFKQHASDVAAGKLAGALTKSKVKIDEGGKTVTVNGVTIKQGLPDNFPKDFPMYAKTKIAASSICKGEESTTTFSVTASKQDVVDFYIKNLKEQGWTVKETTYGELSMLEIAKDSLAGKVSITKDKSKTMLIINIKPAK